jgi:DNA (cytosine-5)-methyltransferase 1
MSAKKRKNGRENKRPQFRAIDLFSGCGGLTLGLKQAGFRVIGAVEIDPLAVETYKANHKRVVVWAQDIRTLSVAEVKRKLRLGHGKLDLLAGCPPCQGFSRMTTLNGRFKVRDPRNDLIYQFLRFVRGLRPKSIMLENVPGLAKDRRLKKLSGELAKIGYHSKHDVLDAAEYGVPQRRRRFIFVAGRKSNIPFARPSTRKLTVRDAFRRLRRIRKSDKLHNFPEKRAPKVVRLIRLIPKNGGSRLNLGLENQLACHRSCNGFKDVYGRMSWEDVAPTITGGCCNPSKGRFLHPTRNRAITLREAALLQSFPPTYYFSVRKGKFAVADMIGNALPPQFIRRHAKRIYSFLKRLSRNRRHPYVTINNADSIHRRDSTRTAYN